MQGVEATENVPRLVADNRGLVAHNIGKRFKKRPVVRGVSLELQRVEVVGLLGPNGAGKTTCMRIISGELSADDGAVLVSDTEVDGVADARAAGVAYCPQHDAVPAYLTGREATELFARLGSS